MRRSLATCLTLLVALAGCGQSADSSEDFSGEEARVATAVEDLQQAAADREERRVCRQLLSAQLARQAGDCNAVVDAAFEDSDTFELDVQDVAITGDRARVRVETGAREPQTETYELVRENGGWRFASFGG
jgi:hypothetical protein